MDERRKRQPVVTYEDWQCMSINVNGENSATINDIVATLSAQKHARRARLYGLSLVKT